MDSNIENDQLSIRIANLPKEIKIKIVLNLPVTFLRIFYRQSDYKNDIDLYLKSIPETTVISQDERLLNSLICLPMLYGVELVYAKLITKFTIVITGKEFNGGYISPVTANISIDTNCDNYTFSGTGSIENNMAIGSWDFEGTCNNELIGGTRKIKRIESSKNPNLLFVIHSELFGGYIFIFNPIEKYYISYLYKDYSVKFFEYEEMASILKNINKKCHTRVVREESLINYPGEMKLLQNYGFIPLRKKNYNRIVSKHTNKLHYFVYEPKKI